MIEIRCDVCGSAAVASTMHTRDRLLNLPGEFRMVRCAVCGFFYQNPQLTPPELISYYPSEYFPYSIAVADEAHALTRWDRAHGVRKRCQKVMQFAGRCGTILDVGCATGNFLHQMQQYGWTSYGVDISEQAVAYARKRFGLNITHGHLHSACYPSELFDVVTMWDVLEHVYHPRATLAETARVLKPSGWLVLSLPNPESIEAKLFGRFWAGWDAPRHLQLFTRSVLKTLLKATGFELIRTISFTGRFHVLSLSLQFWLNEKMREGLPRRVAHAASISLALRLLMLPYYSAADRFNQSSVMTVIARRCPQAP